MEQVDEMLAMRRNGAPYNDIAAQYGVTPSTAGKLVRKRARRAA